MEGGEGVIALGHCTNNSNNSSDRSNYRSSSGSIIVFNSNITSNYNIQRKI